MAGRFHVSGGNSLPQHLHRLLLAGGLLGLLLWIISDVRSAPGRMAVPAAATGGAGMQPLTAGRAMDGFGAWSPDGREVAFMRSGRIWLMAADGGGQRQLTSQPEVWDSVSAWRPDGAQLAFVRLSLGDEAAHVMLIDPKTGREQELTEEKEPIGHLAWAPDGQSLYYATQRQVKQVDLKGKGKQVLNLPEGWEMLAGGLALSPDGKRLIYGAGQQKSRGVQYDLWSVRLGASGEPEQLTRGGGIMPGFDRSGQRLVYRNPRQPGGIYLMDLPRHQTARIVADEPGALYFHPAFSPDGKRLLLSRLVLEGDGSGGQGGSRFISHLWLHRLASSGREWARDPAGFLPSKEKDILSEVHVR